MSKTKTSGLIAAFVLVLTVSVLPAQTAPATWNTEDTTRIVNLVQRRLSSLTNLGVFDDITFGIQGKRIVLHGFASRPILRSDAENALRNIDGIEGVDNQIEVLPVSNMDDRIRAAVYNAIYSFPSLRRYGGRTGPRNAPPSVARMAGGITNDPPRGFHAISIIVRNGHVILRGAVLSQADANTAEIRANTVSGVFSVTNELRIENSRS